MTATPSYDYDLFVIGAGSGGVRAARMSAAFGAKTAIAEEYRIGGTCVIRGCVPKKLLIYASEFGHEMADIAPGYGWTYAGVKFDWPTLRDNVAAEVDRLSGIYARNLRNGGIKVFEARAELIGPHEVHLSSGTIISAKTILIATGGKPAIPTDVPGIEHAITSNEVFLLDTLPKSILIAGGGYIAVEFAFLLKGLGVDVTLLYRGDNVLRGFDDDVRLHVHGELKRKGVRVITHCRVSSIDKSVAGLSVRLTNGQALGVDALMLAIGREPYSEGLGCEAAGLTLKPNGAIMVDAYSQTTVPSIYAVGDVTDRKNLTPVAIREGACFAHTVFGGQPMAFDHDTIATAVFSQPPTGTVGLSEADARAKYGPVDIYKTTFRPMRYVMPNDETRMLMKLIVRPSDDVVIGCHMVGPDAAEIIQAVGIAVKCGLTKAQFDATCAVHPTVAEELVTMKEKWVTTS
ncbi:glutathione-disulfide reductase [Candidatus Phycosocius spiralis]|uniref:Glutathione reductase n=1 Tax=Candidatus Phycosocius spiralis TaxID=2815099 RepID=A0ABQ4PST1_9PROT|nr:glutathione-disulfide reductase [Candidatus Phycosocius spiralis]GIU66059.1 glutathione-disulfide reductase [Candidatus Phycosocius spiralis]